MNNGKNSVTGLKKVRKLKVIKAMAEIGNPNSITDAGVGALCARTAVLGAFMNVKINAASYNDKKFINDIITSGSQMEYEAIRMENEIVQFVNEKIKLH